MSSPAGLSGDNSAITPLRRCYRADRRTRMVKCDQNTSRVVAALAAVAATLALAACGSTHHASSDAGHADFLKFSVCMRAHGVSNFPDPSSGGGIRLNPGSGVDPQSPAFQAAQTSCKRFLPGGGPPPVSEAQKRQAVQFAECMRAHGVPSFPDPTFPPGGGIFQAAPQAGITLNSPAFRHASAVCGGPKNSAAP